MSTTEPKNSHTQNDHVKQSPIISPANIEWLTDDTGNKVPVSAEFDDVYFSHANGLAESRYVFIDGNILSKRLVNLAPKQVFTIVELGFGTGLNLLAVWQLWQQLRNDHAHLATSRLHFITTEKHPLTLTDLTQILALWTKRAPELADNINALLTTYPSLIAGCHRLHFTADNLILDIWLGDAATSLAKLSTDNTLLKPQVDAWFLDGFAPSCNESLWTEAIFAQLQRLSSIGTTVATYSCAGVVKRGLQACGFDIKKVTGFGRKKQMLTAMLAAVASVSKDNDTSSVVTPVQSMTTHLRNYNSPQTLKPTQFSHFNHSIVIGAGVAGLMTAWSLASRGISVTLLDKIAPLAGASGNPRALLAPKMTPIHHVDEHLHTIGYLYSCRLYQQFNLKTQQLSTSMIIEPTGALDLLLKANIGSQQITEYPDDLATTLTNSHAKTITGLNAQNLSENLYLPQSGLVDPQALKTVIMAHPLITFRQLDVIKIEEESDCVSVNGYANYEEGTTQITLQADNIVICAAFESHYLDSRIFDCRKIRGQLSWFTPTTDQLAQLPKLPLKYGGYCALFTAQADDQAINNVAVNQPQFLLGASFVRNDVATDMRSEEHQISRDKLIKAIPELDAIVPADTQLWQARAGVRTQTPDYHPIVGRLPQSSRLWTLSAMGAKGYAFAPVCAEALVAMMLGEFAPLSTVMLAKLAPNRTRLQTPLSE